MRESIRSMIELEADLGSRVIDQIMIDIYNHDLSLAAIANRNSVTVDEVRYVVSYHKMDPDTREDS